MQRWRWPFLGIDQIPAWLTELEIEYFFRFSVAELALIRTRRGADCQIGLALQIGFLRMSGRVLNSTDIIPRGVLRLISEQLGVRALQHASLRSLYHRRPTLHEHQNLAKRAAGFRDLGEHAKRMLVADLRRTRGASIVAPELATRARQWLYEHKYLIPGERAVLDLARSVLHDSETKLLRDIERSIPLATRAAWFDALAARIPLARSLTGVQWLKAPVRSRRGLGLAEAFHKVQHLLSLDVERSVVPDIPLAMAKAYAARVARTKLVRFTRLRRTTRTISIVYFMRLALWRAADDAIEAWMMRVAELRGEVYGATSKTGETIWQTRLDTLVGRFEAIAADQSVEKDAWRGALTELCASARLTMRKTRAERAREEWVMRHASVRRLLRLILMLPVRPIKPEDRALATAIDRLRTLYGKNRTQLDGEWKGGAIERTWDVAIACSDRGMAMRALEVAVLQRLQRGLRNGSVTVSASLSYRARESLFVPRPLWARRSGTLTAALGIALSFTAWSQALTRDLSHGLREVARAVRKGLLEVAPNGIALPRDPPLPWRAAEEEDSLRRTVAELRGPIELPRLMLEVDSRVRFSALLLKRVPRSGAELKALYAALLAHGTGLDRTEVTRMVAGVGDRSLSVMMQLLEDEERIREANTALVQSMQQCSIVQSWGVQGLASSDMMTLEATRRLWNARNDPRRRTKSIGTYTHVLDQWGIAYDQPIVLNRRQAGAAIEGALRQRVTTIDRLAVDTHGYTDVAMGIAKLLGFDLCPRLAMLRDRKLTVPSGQRVPAILASVVEPIHLQLIERHWMELLRVASSIKDGWCTATQVLDRFGSAARGDPLYQAAVALGRLVRARFLCTYFTDIAFREAIRRVLNHGESVHALQRRIRAGAIGPKRGRGREEQAAISGSLSLLANAVMVWNTHRLQAIVDAPARYAHRIAVADLAELGPMSTRHVNFRGILEFPVEEYQGPILGNSEARHAA